MFVKFTEQAQKALVIAESSAYHFGCEQVDSCHLLLSLLKMDDLKITQLLKTYQVTDQKIIAMMDIKDEISSFYLEYSEELRRVLEIAMEMSKKQAIHADLLGYVLVNDAYEVRMLLQSFGVDLEYVCRKLLEERHDVLDDIEELNNLNKKVKEHQIVVVGRDQEMQLVMELLCRKEKNNVIIVGDAGVGKTALVEKLAGHLNQVNEYHPLYGKQIYELDLPGVLAGTKYRGDFEEKLKKIINALKDQPNVIIFIDEIHNLVGSGKAEGAIDGANILKPYLARGEITCIGATTYQEYQKYFESDPALNRRFAKIDLKEPNNEDVLNVLMGLKDNYESFHHVELKKENFQEIITLTSRYMKERHQPDKALDVLDLCCVKARMTNQKEITSTIIQAVVESLCGFSLETNKNYNDLFHHLKNLFPNEINVIEVICESFKNNNQKIKCRKVPIQLMKEAAMFLRRHLIVVKMSDYQDSLSYSHFMHEGKQKLLQEMKRYPDSIVLLEHFSIAPKSILLMFKQMFDENEYEDVDTSCMTFVIVDETKVTSTGFLSQK